MNDYPLTFFHELVHYVAAVINYHNDGLFEPASINLERKPDTLEFRGEMVVRVAEDHKRKVPAPERTKLAELLAKLYYGCIFQSYFLQTGLENCLCLKGKRDNYDAIGILLAYGHSGKEPDIIEAAANHLQLLRDSRALQQIVIMNPVDYLINKENNFFSLDMSLLKSDTEAFIENHKSSYHILLDDFRKILK